MDEIPESRMFGNVCVKKISSVCVCIGHFTLTVAGWHSVWLVYTVQKI